MGCRLAVIGYNEDKEKGLLLKKETIKNRYKTYLIISLLSL